MEEEFTEEDYNFCPYCGKYSPNIPKQKKMKYLMELFEPLRIEHIQVRYHPLAKIKKGIAIFLHNDKFTILEISKILGIPNSTLYKWKREEIL